MKTEIVGLLSIVAIGTMLYAAAPEPDIHPQIQQELRLFVVDMAEQLQADTGRQCGYYTLADAYMALLDEHLTTDNQERIDVLTARLANAAMMVRHNRKRVER